MSDLFKGRSLTAQVVFSTAVLMLAIFVSYVLVDWSFQTNKTLEHQVEISNRINALLQQSAQNVIDHNATVEMKETMDILTRDPLISGISVQIDVGTHKQLSFTSGTPESVKPSGLTAIFVLLPFVNDSVVLTSSVRGNLTHRAKWVAGVTINFNVNHLYAPYEGMLIRHVLVLLGMIFTIACLAFLFHQRIHRPILLIIKALEARLANVISPHDTIEPVGQYELDALILGFNHYQNLVWEAHQSRQRQITHLEECMLEKTGYLQSALEKSMLAEKNQKKIFQILTHDLKEAVLASEFQAEALRRNVNLQFDKDTVAHAAKLGQSMRTIYDKLEEILSFSVQRPDDVPVKIEKTDLYREAESLIDRAGFSACQKGIELNLIYDPRLPSGIEAPKDGIRQLLNALISSGIKETVAGHVTLELSRGEDIIDAAFFLHIDLKASCPPVQPERIKGLRLAASHGVVVVNDFEVNALALRIALSNLREMSATFEMSSNGHETHVSISVPVIMTDDALSMDQQAAKKATRGKNLLFLVPNVQPVFCKSIVSRLSYLRQSARAVGSEEDIKRIAEQNPQSKLVLIGQRLGSAEMRECFMPIASIRNLRVSCLISLEQRYNQEENLILPNLEHADVTQDMAVQMRTVINCAVNHCYPRGDQLHDIFMQQSPLLEAETLKSTKILLVDDTTSVLDGMSEFLSSYGATVVTTRSALDASRRVKEEHFDAICTDISMPQMSGIELGFEIRESDLNRNTPIIGMTAAALTDQEMSDTSMLKMTVLKKHGIMELVLPTLSTQIRKSRSGEQEPKRHLRIVNGVDD